MKMYTAITIFISLCLLRFISCLSPKYRGFSRYFKRNIEKFEKECMILTFSSTVYVKKDMKL